MLIELYNENITSLFDLLLKDRNTDKNITWCTNDYLKYGENYRAECEITRETLNDMGSSLVDLLQPRVTKSKEIQKGRTKEKAEVFTPSWICEYMNNHCEQDWFDKNKKRFDTNIGLVHKDFLKSYIDLRKLEITCGEAPFVVSCYDTVSGNIIPLYNRIGFLDKKLTAICHYIDDMDEWFNWVCRAYESSYGYEYQGDNLFKARLNLIQTFLDYYEKKWNNVGFPTDKQLEKLSRIIVRNFWQMDGLTYTVPNTDIKCKVYNWRSKKNMDLTGEDSMKFDYIIGNPPYQEERENTSDKPIYNDFMDNTYQLSDKVMLITPARFLFNAGRTPKKWNEKMLQDAHLKVLKYEPVSKKIFGRDVDIKGGVVVTYRDKTQDFGAIKDFTPYNELNSLLQKINKDSNFISLNTIMYPYSTYALTEKLFKDYPDIEVSPKNAGYHKLSNNKIITTNIFELLPDLFFDKKQKSDDIGILGREDGKRICKYIKSDYVSCAENYNKYKVIIPAANGSGAIGETLSTPLVGVPLVGYTQSFLGIGSFDTKEEAEALLKYICSKFARTCLGILKITQHNPPEKWRYVPIQDFTENSDIDWSVSISEIDKQLYKKYGLDEKEIVFIEEKVKEME